MDYCNSLLFNISKQQISRIQRMMNRTARVVLNTNFPYHHQHTQHSSTNLLRLHWLPIPYRILFKLAVITYKVRSTSSPSYLHNLVKEKTANCTKRLRSMSAPMLVQPHTKNNISQRAFRNASPFVWNSLPTSVRNSLSLGTFKSRLKTFYFQEAFHDLL